MTLRAAVTGCVKRGLNALGVYERRLRRDRFPGVAVLCYHGIREGSWPRGTMRFEGLHVTAAELESHCRVLRRCCQPIGLALFRAALRGEAELPERPVLVTFDDGYRTVWTLARPVLQRYAMPAAFFVCSEPAARRQRMWYDAVAGAAGEAEVERLKGLPYEGWRELYQRSQVQVEDADPHALLLPDEVRALAEVPGFEVGCHTARHPILARAGREQQCEEILAGKVTLEGWTGRPVRSFAYPNGRYREDYTEETVRILAEAGFDVAFTTRPGFNSSADGRLECRRFFMTAGLSGAELAHRLCYSWRG